MLSDSCVKSVYEPYMCRPGLPSFALVELHGPDGCRPRIFRFWRSMAALKPGLGNEKHLVKPVSNLLRQLSLPRPKDFHVPSGL